jgi:hypothetical protein
MFEKDGKFYADWRDRTGRRKRKSFTSQRAALRFEMEQKELAHPKMKALGRQSRTSSAPPILKTPSIGEQRATSSQRLCRLRQWAKDRAAMRAGQVTDHRRQGWRERRTRTGSLLEVRGAIRCDRFCWKTADGGGISSRRDIANWTLGCRN